MSTTDGEAVRNGERVDLHDGEADPMILLGPGTPSRDFYVFLQRMRQFGYEVDVEHVEEHQTAYRVHFPAEGGHR